MYITCSISLCIMLFPFHLAYQEIVNLILTGYAVSNVFNNTQELGVEGKDKVRQN